MTADHGLKRGFFCFFFFCFVFIEMHSACRNQQGNGDAAEKVPKIFFFVVEFMQQLLYITALILARYLEDFGHGFQQHNNNNDNK